MEGGAASSQVGCRHVSTDTAPHVSGVGCCVRWTLIISQCIRMPSSGMEEPLLDGDNPFVCGTSLQVLFQVICVCAESYTATTPLPCPSPHPLHLAVQGTSCVCMRMTRVTSPYDRAASQKQLPHSSASVGAPTGASLSCTRGKWAGPWGSPVSSLVTHQCTCSMWTPRSGSATRSVMMAVQ